MPKTPSLSFLEDDRVQFMMATLEKGGFESLVVGGAARDGLRGETPKDIDLATRARPDDVQRLFGETQATLHPTGIDHGTWTVVMGDLPVEITTYRRDVATDGRRATIAFADTFDEDAQRRDFTINALGIDRHGAIKDPTGEGLSDLDKGLVRFVGNAQDRCDEDALRVLRLFRFQGRMGQWPMDAEALQAARQTPLDNLSGERIWSEMKGIFKTPTADKVVGEMVNTGVMTRLLPSQDIDLNALSQTMAREQDGNIDPHWARRLYAATGRTRLPWPMAGKEAKHLKIIDQTKPYFGKARVSAAATQDASIGMDAWCLGTGGERTPITAAQDGASQTLPVQAKDFMDAGVKPGPKLGKMLANARQSWLDNDLSLDVSKTLSKVKETDHTR